MKKHRTQVPDFSHKHPTRPGTPGAAPGPDASKGPVAPPARAVPVVKPRATSAKSGGRRGQ